MRSYMCEYLFYKILYDNGSKMSSLLPKKLFSIFLTNRSSISHSPSLDIRRGKNWYKSIIVHKNYRSFQHPHDIVQHFCKFLYQTERQVLICIDSVKLHVLDHVTFWTWNVLIKS